MERVLDRLWIGSSADLAPGVPLRGLGFSGIVDLRDASTYVPRGDDVPVHRVDRRDGDGWTALEVEGIVTFIDQHLRTGCVLVACAAGQSRSASVVIGYLVRSGWDVATAYRAVKKARAQVAPVEAMLNSVLRVVEPRRVL